MLNATSLKNYEDFKRTNKHFWSIQTSSRSFVQNLLTATDQSPSGRSWKPSPCCCVVCLLRPALVCICKYSISDICSLIIFKSDQDTTAAEAIHKEAHILFLLLFFFVGMELVSTKPTKPTCSYVLNKRLFIFFCLFLFITGVYDGVQDDKEREGEKKKTINGEGKQKRGKKDERDKERMKSIREGTKW